MGSQQLLLLALSVIVVGLMVFAGISIGNSYATSSNRDQIIEVIQYFGGMAQSYFKKPKELAGGGGSYEGFNPPLSAASVISDITIVSESKAGKSNKKDKKDKEDKEDNKNKGNDNSLTITSVVSNVTFDCVGTHTGSDGTSPVHVTAVVDVNGIRITILN